MDRRERLLFGITPAQRGIEVAPWHNPAAPKRAGYDVLVLDVFDTETLRARAAADPHIPPADAARIEPVDLLGSAVEIAALAEAHGAAPGSLDYILSSHNFEHLPDPVRFLQGSARLLRPGGVVSMAIPDRRVCFDFFRPASVTADLLEAYLASAGRPTPKQVFLQAGLQSMYHYPDGRVLGVHMLADDPARIHLVPEAGAALRAAWAEWRAAAAESDGAPYRDAHCWTFTPASFAVLIADLGFLGLVPLRLKSLEGPEGCEFFVQLERPPAAPAESPGAFQAAREALLHRANNEAGQVIFAALIEARHLRRFAADQ
jgi:SAM-dependent methyltransferase